MDEGTKSEVDLDGSNVTVQRVKGNGGDPVIPKPEVTNLTKMKVMGFLLILLGAVLAFGFLYESDEEDVANQTSTEQQTSDDRRPVNTLTLDTLEASVKQNQVIWKDSLQATLEAYDQSNDNVSYSFADSEFTVTGNGLPTHSTGDFPNPNNPNSISEQNVTFTIPRAPVFSGSATPVRIFGYSLGGVKMEPGTAETDPVTGWSIEAFNSSNLFNPGIDEHQAHVQPNGTYHYHGLPSVLNTTGEEHSNLIGFAADGFPIYGNHGYRDPLNADGPTDHMTSSWRLKTGTRGAGEPEGTYNGDYTNDYQYVEGAGDLDECNGRFTVTPDFPDGVYAYFITEQFPFVGRCVMGEVIAGFDSVPSGQPQPAPQRTNR